MAARCTDCRLESRATGGQPRQPCRMSDTALYGRLPRCPYPDPHRLAPGQPTSFARLLATSCGSSIATLTVCRSMPASGLPGALHRLPPDRRRTGYRPGIGHRGNASGVTAFLPGMTHYSHGFLMAHTDELFAVIVPHVGNVKGGVRLTLTRLVDIARDGDAARRTDDDTVRVASGLLHELPKFLNLTSKVLQRDEDWHPAVGNARRLRHTLGSGRR